LQIQEKNIALFLFASLSLALPVLGSAFSGEEKPTADDVPFLVQSAMVEMKFDVWAAPYPEVVEAMGGTFFSAQSWLDLAQHMEKADDRERLLKPLVIACLALGRKDDADLLINKGELHFGTADPFSFLATGTPVPSEQRLKDDAGASPLPEWLTAALVKAWGGEAGIAGGAGGAGTGTEAAATKLPADRVRESAAAALAPALAVAVAVAVGFTLMFFAGVVLLLFARRVLTAWSVPVWSNGAPRFECTTLQTFAVFALWLAAFMLAHLIAVPAAEAGTSGARLIFVVYAIHAAVGVALVRKWGNVPKGALLKAVDLEPRSITPKSLLFGAGAAVMAVPVVVVLMQVSLMLFGAEGGVSPAVPVLVDADGALDRWLLVANVVLVAPLFEEFLFRAFLFQQFRRAFGLTHAVLLSALVFAAIHQSIEFFVPLFGLGVILALVYHHTQSLWASVVAHGLYNGFTVVLVAVLYGWA